MYTKKALLKLIIPLIIEQLLSISVGMIDIFMVSYLGEEAISGISLVDSINVLIIGLFAALCTGGSIIVAQYLGNKDSKSASKVASSLLVSATVLAIILALISLIGNIPIIRFFFRDIEADVLKNASNYFLVTALSFPMIALYNSYASIFRAMGNSKISMLVSLCANLTNVIGNTFFLYVLDLGVIGVAISTLISRALAAIILMILIQNRKYPIHLHIRDMFQFNIKMVRKILSIGIPNGIESSIFQIGKIIVSGFITSFGTGAIAANALVSNISQFPVIPINAIGLAMLTVVGQCVGAGNYEEAKYYVKKMMRWTYLILGVLSILLFCFATPLAHMYHLEETTYPIVINLLRYYSVICMLFLPASFALPNALRAANDVKYTMLISIASMWIWRIVFSYILGVVLGYGIYGVWAAMGIDWICRALCFTKRYVSGKWKNRTNLDA